MHAMELVITSHDQGYLYCPTCKAERPVELYKGTVRRFGRYREGLGDRSAGHHFVQSPPGFNLSLSATGEPVND